MVYLVCGWFRKRIRNRVRLGGSFLVVRSGGLVFGRGWLYWWLERDSRRLVQSANEDRGRVGS